ncbi:MAG: tRNA preQ1(34) S-adenosylmethionine ribosyltransferase-isomerase QueA [Deltaproteobacteria bacterium]|nr:tRNA preQ1(34) S-adenosylmethionine ribosyltransferase-isomerase QueA [Deltaproteobacteria bacterium]
MNTVSERFVEADFLLSDYDYELPDGLIAQKPADRRDGSRLLHLDRGTGGISHLHFDGLVDLLNPGDLLVVNNTRVIPARLMGKKETGGQVEVLLIDYAGAVRIAGESEIVECDALVRASRAPIAGSGLLFDAGLTARVLGRKDSVFRLRFQSPGSFDDVLKMIGRIPLPPYIRRDGEAPPCDDGTAYQTVYAEKDGAVAAPTAGLHFSRQLFDRLAEKGVETVSITLHVGYGTFMPVRVDDIRDHRIHAERFFVSYETAQAINDARASGRRVVAVGTTSVRTLEYVAGPSGRVMPGPGVCDLFIYPGYKFKCVDAMITNFHLPKTTLLMLVAAFAGRARMLDAYRAAIERRYRFYSYGDAMFIG